MFKNITCSFAFRGFDFWLTKRNHAIRNIAIRTVPFTMKLDSPEFRSIFSEELNVLKDIFDKYGHQLRIAGGAVRDLLLHQKPVDLDFATTATPEQMKDIFNAEGIRMINSRGESHGTITVRINDVANFEVTTLRIDVVTDGRHAEVEFTTDWNIDSERRDLTINSMFLRLDGTVYDYFNGYEDLQNRKVAFVGNADRRIKEDFLRILRYFRFYGKIAVEPNCHDPKTLSVIRDNLAGLKGISGERIWSELKKILSGNHSGALMETIIDIGMAPFVGLPDKVNREEFKKVYRRSKHLAPHAITLLVALVNSVEEMLRLYKRLKLSSYDRDLGLFVVMHRHIIPHDGDSKQFKTLIASANAKVSNVEEWTYEVLKYQGNDLLLQELKSWSLPKFPVNGGMLMEKGLKSGPKFKYIIGELKKVWINSDFELNGEQLLEHLPDILENMKPSSNKS